MAKKKKPVHDKLRNKNTSPDTKVVISVNRRARHDYFILDTYEAGIVLVGTEVKSLRSGKVSLSDAFATVDRGEVWLRNMHIGEYAHGSWMNHAPKRNRKLLLHRRQIDKLIHKQADNSLTLVPLSLYFLGGYAKVELALAKGKKLYDKRDALAEKQARFDMVRKVGRSLKGAYS